MGNHKPTYIYRSTATWPTHMWTYILLDLNSTSGWQGGVQVGGKRQEKEARGEAYAIGRGNRQRQQAEATGRGNRQR